MSRQIFINCNVNPIMNYLIGGLIPISINSTDDMLAKYNLESVKVTTEFDIVDWLISGITGGLVVTKSVIIEGNAKNQLS